MKKTLSWIERNGKKLLGVTLSVAAALTSADALAAPGGGGGTGMGQGTYTIKVAAGVSRKQTLQTNPSGMVRATQDLGVGAEHARLEVLGDTLVMVWNTTDVSGQTGTFGTKCSAIKLNASGPPTIVADQVQISWQRNGNNNDRGGHPALACRPSDGRCIVSYGSNREGGNNNTQTYALAIDGKTCKDLTGENNHVVLNADANNNEAAPNVQFDGQKFVFQYYSNNNNAVYGELVDVVADPNTIGGWTVKQLSNPQRLINSNIGHGTILATSPTRALYTDCAGNQRPCEAGIRVYYLNTDVKALDANGQMPVLWKQTLVKAQPDKNNIGGIDGLPGPLGGRGVYPASPQLAMGANGLVHLVSFISDGAGHNRNKKGSSTNHVLTFKPDDTGPNVLGQTAGALMESNHLGACSAKVGIVGSEQQVAVAMGHPPTSFGAASLTFVKESQTTPLAAGATQAFHTVVGSAAVSSTNADGGYLNNMLGRNPGTQGRNHLFCLGDVVNPSYGATNGFMPHVKTFIATPWSGRVQTPGTPAAMATQALNAAGKMVPEDRNALFLTLVAAVRDPQAPAPPAVQPPSNPNQIPGTAPTPGTPGDPGTPGTPGTTGSFSSGCSVAMGASDTGSAAAFFLVAFGLALVARRRWS